MTLELLHEPKMADLTSLGIGGTARALAKVRDEAGLDELAFFHEKEAAGLIAIGEGSNMLAADGKLNIAFVHMALAKKNEPEISGLTVRVSADTRLPGLLAFLIRNGLSGMEGLAGIPGSVGGSIAMNAGSYGTDMAASVTRVRLWTPSKGLFWKNADEMNFGYRHFSPETGEFTFIWEAEFLLNRSFEAVVKSKVQEVFSKKKSSQPVLEKTAGCVFKNPEGYSAGKLLDDAGFKGKTLGGMAFSEMHANFLVNKGQGTGAEALELLDMATEAVNNKFGITLETEVIVLQ
ncbi:UDP-N-acetylmuramate dehydrogenase [Maridesulfovibrio ferrireducens]|uniref:UDP-N-acetylmuramate dehydrogenase n=1 Tax=Maridesulfovibrio ferrireducens TaxID=246191 RepID=UPI001A17FEBE|nr:UDP-N-acetylmuramate dehydrogenase [Maridesulfovibrio ferrireducens]MBI9109728.1 UDP-N-acetylmuramate dehydrogenase [Maridesulfovibrio ferrireducens]